MKLICGDSANELKNLASESVDLTITSPPYDGIRSYDGYTFDFKSIAKELLRVTKKGGIVVWIIGDQIIDGDNSGTSFNQALFFKEIGFKLYDVIIYAKNNISFPNGRNRYHRAYEYMFILSKGKPKTTNLIADKKNKWGGTANWGNLTERQKDGTLKVKPKKYVKEYGIRYNIWYYTVGKGHSTHDSIAYEHPAIFPEKLAYDHIISWTNEKDLVLDPFCGSGTTCKMAKQLNRDFIGIEISEKYLQIAKSRTSQEYLLEEKK